MEAFLILGPNLKAIFVVDRWDDKKSISVQSQVMHMWDGKKATCEALGHEFESSQPHMHVKNS